MLLIRTSPLNRVSSLRTIKKRAPDRWRFNHEEWITGKVVALVELKVAHTDTLVQVSVAHLV